MKRDYHSLALNKAHPVRDIARREAWAAEHEVCACCWFPAFGFGGWLETHHLIKCGRSDEECNLLRLCNICHKLAECEPKVYAPSGGYYPALTLGMCLTLKKESDAEHWNPERLEQLYHKRLPDLEPVPEVFLDERLRR